MIIENIKYIFTDLDDTLYDAHSIYGGCLYASWECFLKYSSSSSCFLSSYDDFKKSYAYARQGVKSLLPSGASSHNRLLYFKKMTENLYGSTRPELCLAMDRAYESAYDVIDYKSASQVFDQLHKKYHIGVVTNHMCHTQIKKLSLLDPKGNLFSWVLTSEEVGSEKPDMKIYHAALALAQCKPSEVVMIGDDIHADVWGALQVGIKSIYLNSQGKKSEDLKGYKKGQDWYEVANLSGLLEILV